MPRLLANFGTPNQCELPLQPGINTLGRGVENHFNIDHESVSAAHCQVVVDGEVVRVQDLGSVSGTFIDQSPVQEGELRSGQTLRLGDVELLFDADSPVDLGATYASIEGEPPVPPPMSSGQPALTGPAMCRNHPKTHARLHCTQCHSTFCDLCVATRTGKYFCRRCGGECAIVEPVLTFEEDRPAFFAAVSGAFIYPFQGDGIILIVAGTICYTFLTVILSHGKLAMIGMMSAVAFILLSIFAGGYLFSYIARIITSTAQGDKSMPDWPEFGGWGDVAGPLFQYAIVIVGSFLPLFVPYVLAANQVEWAPNLIVPGMCLGAIYLPMAFLAVAMYDNVAAMNPLLVIPSITRVWKEYLIVCVMLAAVLVISRVLDGALGFLNSGFFVALALQVPASFFSLYCFIVEARILGLLYRYKKEELGWGN